MTRLEKTKQKKQTKPARDVEIQPDGKAAANVGMPAPALYIITASQNKNNVHHSMKNATPRLVRTTDNTFNG